MLDKLKEFMSYFKRRDEMGKVANFVAEYIDIQVNNNLGYVLIASQAQLQKLINRKISGLSEKEVNLIIRRALNTAFYNMRVNYAVEKKTLYLKLKKEGK